MLDGVHFYNQTLKKTVAVFGTIFNNIKIVRRGLGETRVPLAYGPIKKFLARIESDNEAASDKGIAIKLPRMSFEITSIDKNTTTALNKLNVKRFEGSGTHPDGPQRTKKILKQSVPYDIGIQLNIIAKNQDDALQIFEQIIPTFVPEYTVAIMDMEGPGNSVDVPIILNGTSFEDSYEGDFVTRRTLIYTLDFTVKVRFTGRVYEKPVIRFVEADLYNNSTPESVSEPIDRVATELGSEDDTEEDFTTNTSFGFDDNP
jgi:hypothetical protein|tara:strand:- start:371 stop:1147 length:777 start_codon:yes stop_codon:yes gene_type:complete